MFGYFFWLFTQILDRAYLIGDWAKTCLLFVLFKIYIYFIQERTNKTNIVFAAFKLESKSIKQQESSSMK